MADPHVRSGGPDDEPIPERPAPRRRERFDRDDDEDNPPQPFGREYEKDRQYLHLLTIFQFVLAGLATVMSLCPIAGLAMGIFMLSSAAFPTTPAVPGAPSSAPPPQFLGWVMVAEYSFFLLLLLVQATVSCIVGFGLKRRKRWLTCMICSGIQCLFIPFGTVLGVFTIIVLVRESVKKLFQQGEPRIADEDYA
jgi:hypothetical protein